MCGGLYEGGFIYSLTQTQYKHTYLKYPGRPLDCSLRFEGGEGSCVWCIWNKEEEKLLPNYFITSTNNNTKRREKTPLSVYLFLDFGLMPKSWKNRFNIYLIKFLFIFLFSIFFIFIFFSFFSSFLFSFLYYLSLIPNKVFSILL